MTVLHSGAATDVGRVRSTNQDLALESADLFAVADGMGGHVGGEVAARIAIDALEAAFSRQSTVEGLRQAVVEANAAVWEESQTREELRGMGTTLTAVGLVSGADGRDVIALSNVGDSRAYVFSGGGITQITADHSLAEEKVRQGELTEAEAAVHPHRHILTRALGVSGDVEVDVWELHLQSGDRIVLCSDGLNNEVGDEEIAEVLGRVADPSEAARKLVETANDHGGNDNVTVLVIDVLVGEEVQPGSLDTSVPGPADGATGPARPAGPAGEVGDAGASAPATAAATTGIAAAGSEGGGAGGVAAEKIGRRERARERRRAGIPRPVTFRVVLFVVVVAGVLVGGYAFLRWYGTDDWYVTTDGNHLVVYQGHPGGFLWFKPRLVDRSEVTTAEVLPFHLSDLRGGQQEPTLRAALAYVRDLHREFEEQQRIAGGGAITSPTTTVPPTTTVLQTTTVPQTTTATAFLRTGAQPAPAWAA